MAEIVEKLVIQGDISDVTRALDDLSSRLDKTSRENSDHTGKMVAYWELVAHGIEAAGEKLIEFAKESIKEAMAYEKSVIGLQAVLQAQGRDVASNIAVFKRQAEEIQHVSGVTEEHVLTMQRQALAYGISANKSGELIEAAIRLSNATGKDLSTSFEALAKAQAGVDSRMLKLIPGFQNLTDEQLRSGEATDLINRKFANLLGTGTEGSAGKVLQLSNAVGDLGRELANALTSAGPLASAMTALIKGAENFSQRVREGGMHALFESQARVDARHHANEINDNMAKASAAYDQQKKDEMPDLAPITTGKEDAAAASKAEAARIREMKLLTAYDKQVKEEKEKAIAEQNAAIERGQKQEMDALMKNTALEASQNKKLQDGMTETLRSNLERRQHLQELDAEFQQKNADRLTSLTMQTTAVMVNSLVQMGIQGEFSAKKLAGAMVSSIGSQIVAIGMLELAEGTRRVIMSYGTDGTGWTSMAEGAAEVAIGAGLEIAGGRMSGGGSSGIAHSSGGSHGVGGGSGGGGGSAHSGGAYAGGGGRTAGENTGRSVVVEVKGPMSPAEIGVWVNKALNQAQKEGKL